jgi:hypothetical protein
VTSHFGWIDFAEDDRQQMLDILKLFALRDTRDELGIGTVRDAFANYFFPGTTTIQTRARYFLIVPWIYREAAHRGSLKGWSADRLAQEVDRLERSLIDVLGQSGETDGVVGGRSGRQVQRLPSSVYWPGLAALSIRRFAGSQSDLSRWLSRSFGREEDSINLRAAEMDTEAEEHPDVVWHGSLPPAPAELFSECTLALTPTEAEYLRERIRFSHPQSLFAAFFDADSRPLDQAFVWDHPLVHQLGPDLQQAVEDARRFSHLLHGAAYLYNLMLAERWRDLFHDEGKDDRVAEYEDALLKWSEEIGDEWGELRSWSASPEQLWSSPGLREWRPIPATRDFVNRWFAILADCGSPIDIIDKADVRPLIRGREYFLKHANRARLHNADALRRWSGAAGTSRLDFRWGTARTMVRDIWDGIEAGKES